ncbi:universal stress protein [Streptomyces sp. NPDC050548]|uniref:universal stress protein n=1 Tax=Streptomyces sp. NPDC050548 TaxID=3365629 RepID=UPI00379E524F
MSRPVVAGIDGSAASLAAAAWAARKAELRDSPLHMVASWPASAGTPPDAPEASTRRAGPAVPSTWPSTACAAATRCSTSTPNS